MEAMEMIKIALLYKPVSIHIRFLYKFFQLRPLPIGPKP